MSSSEVCGPEGNRGFEPETVPRDGPDKIPVVPKSVSLQEMRPRPSLRDISEYDASEEGGNSSGVFSCSVDISDVCMADLTKLSDSTVCSSAESVNRSTYHRETMTPSLLNSAVMSTPLNVHLRSIASADVLTPMRSPSDSPQFGASDDYLRRNIKFIYKQLSSLMTQLRMEDKYFQTCSQRYEEVIANLEGEIVALKSSKDQTTSDVLTHEKSDRNDLKKSEARDKDCTSENAKENAKVEDTKNILERIAHDLLPQLRSMVRSAYDNLPPCPSSTLWDCDLDLKENNFKNLTTVFDKCLYQLDRIIKAFNGDHQLSAECQEVSSRLENTRLTDSGTESLSSFNDECAKKLVIELENRISELEAANASLKSEYQASCDGIARMAGEQTTPLQVENEAAQLRIDLESAKKTLADTRGDLDKARTELECKSAAYERLLSVKNSERAEIERQVSTSSIDLSKTKRELAVMADENRRLQESAATNENETSNLLLKLRDMETEHKTVVEEFRIKGSRLILENSKLKEELGKLYKALDEARGSAERSTAKFDDLQRMYDSLISQMETKEREFMGLEKEKSALEALLKGKDSVLGRLCSNFNELLAIFRECQDLGLDRDSSATDIDDGFIRLKRRLLDLSQDYITLNNRNKVLEKEALVISAKLKEKELENTNVRKKYDNKCDKLQRTLEKLEDENKALVSQNIAQDEAMRKMKAELKKLESQEARGCQDCSHVRNQLQQLQIDVADKDAVISTLELHIQSCCEYNRKKAQQYKHELHAYKRQLDAHTSYAVDFGLSPKKSKNLSPKVDVGIQSGESFLHHHTGGFVERFKIRELEEKVVKLEKERTVLKRLCKVRSDRIHELESQVSSSHAAK